MTDNNTSVTMPSEEKVALKPASSMQVLFTTFFRIGLFTIGGGTIHMD